MAWTLLPSLEVFDCLNLLFLAFSMLFRPFSLIRQPDYRDARGGGGEGADHTLRDMAPRRGSYDAGPHYRVGIPRRTLRGVGCQALYAVA